MDKVVCGLLVREGQALLVHRRIDRQWYPDCWDLPGGHVEPGETPELALVRELREEIGVRIAPPREPPVLQLVDDLDLTVWVIRSWRGTISNAAPEEHDAIGWFELADALELHFADDEYRAMLRRVLGEQG
jgi:8-oxo-dGTP diphosphatase